MFIGSKMTFVSSNDDGLVRDMTTLRSRDVEGDKYTWTRDMKSHSGFYWLTLVVINSINDRLCISNPVFHSLLCLFSRIPSFRGQEA